MPGTCALVALPCGTAGSSTNAQAGGGASHRARPGRALVASLPIGGARAAQAFCRGGSLGPRGRCDSSHWTPTIMPDYPRRFFTRASGSRVTMPRWKASRTTPQHEGCNYLRMMSLTPISGRQPEAVASVDAMLARDPDDGYAHANKGWALLHQPRTREALEHFREAPHPPTLTTRSKALSRLKARNPIYRWMLGIFCGWPGCDGAPLGRRDRRLRWHAGS